MICQCDAGYTESRALVGARPIDWGRNRLKLKSKDKTTRGKGRWEAVEAMPFSLFSMTRHRKCMIKYDASSKMAG